MGRSLPTSRKYWKRWGRGGAIPLLQQGFPPPYSRLSPRSPHVQVQSIRSPRNTDALVGAVFGIRPERKPGQRADAHLVAPYPERGPVHGAGRIHQPDRRAQGIRLRRARGAVPLGRQREDLYRHQRAVFVILAGRRQDPVRSAALRHVRAGLHGSLFSRRAPRHQLPFAPPARVHRRCELP